MPAARRAYKFNFLVFFIYFINYLYKCYFLEAQRAAPPDFFYLYKCYFLETRARAAQRAREKVFATLGEKVFALLK